MSALSWGKPSQFQTCPLVDGKLPATPDWKDLPNPKEGTLTLTPTEGTETLATEEGGEIVDARYGKTTYVVEWDEFVKKGDIASFEDVDGVVDGEHALRWLPEDEDNEGVLIDRSKVIRTDTFTVADGKLRHYKFKVLKPASGKSVKPYFKDGAAAGGE